MMNVCHVYVMLRKLKDTKTLYGKIKVFVYLSIYLKGCAHIHFSTAPEPYKAGVCVPAPLLHCVIA